MKLALVRERVRGPVTFSSRAVFTHLDEAELKPLLDAVVAAHPEVEVGSYPKWFDSTYKTKVTFDARAPDRLEQAVQQFLESLPQGEPQRIE
jgi:molybdopterin-biosynthesis enzyme MoeA-like protein